MEATSFSAVSYINQLKYGVNVRQMSARLEIKRNEQVGTARNNGCFFQSAAYTMTKAKHVRRNILQTTKWAQGV